MSALDFNAAWTAHEQARGFPPTEKAIKAHFRTVLRKRQGNRCCYCGVYLIHYGGPPPKGGLPRNAETIEHLRRKCEGGGLTADNVALACHDCNNNRGSTDWLTYASMKQGEMAHA